MAPLWCTPLNIRWHGTALLPLPRNHVAQPGPAHSRPRPIPGPALSWPRPLPAARMRTCALSCGLRGGMKTVVEFYSAVINVFLFCFLPIKNAVEKKKMEGKVNSNIICAGAFVIPDVGHRMRLQHQGLETVSAPAAGHGLVGCWVSPWDTRSRFACRTVAFLHHACIHYFKI